MSRTKDKPADWSGGRRACFVLVVIMSAMMSRRSSFAVAWIERISRRPITRIQLPQRLSVSFHRQSSFYPSVRWFATFDESAGPKDNDDEDGSNKSKKKSKKKKFKVRENIGQEQLDKLAQAFDELARKDGFDASSAIYADDETFEDDFTDDDFLDFGSDRFDDERFDDDSDLLDSSRFDINDFTDGDDDTEDGFSQGVSASDDDDDDMAARIAAARRDMNMGKVTVPKELDDFAGDLSPADMRELGFRQEINPFGNDETPRKDQFKLITNSMVCSACGMDFQCSNEQKPGYIPPEKYEIQAKLKKIEEMQNIQEKASSDEWSVDDEVEWLIRSGGDPRSTSQDGTTSDDTNVDQMAEQMGLDLVELSKKKIICKRCHGLQNFGKVENALRPGWTKEPMLSQENFRELLRPIREKPAVIIALIDLFDFAGSVLPELDSIAGENPVILAANKADLLPPKMGKVRAENWVRRELEYLGVKSLADIGGAVRLVSCKTGSGIGAMLSKARALAEEMDCNIYVVGAANAGKSTLLNYILGDLENNESDVRKKRAGNANAKKGALTTSPLPGTTLKFIKVDLGQGRNLYDTPGLLVPGTITQILTPEELKMVVPKKQVEPLTFRLGPGKCMLIGGLARIEVMEESKPFLFTAFVSNDIKLHLTDSARVEDVLRKHTGTMLTPPLSLERMDEIGNFEDHVINIDGNGWKEAAADITLTGLGWVAVTGAGAAKVKISVPEGIGVSVRPPLMPFDIWESTAKYTGTRAYRRTTKSASGKKRRGVGRR